MTSVIEFSKWQRDVKSPATHFGPAQLVIFPGVRFERLESKDGVEFFEPPLKSSKTSA